MSPSHQQERRISNWDDIPGRVLAGVMRDHDAMALRIDFLDNSFVEFQVDANPQISLAIFSLNKDGTAGDRVDGACLVGKEIKCVIVPFLKGAINMVFEVLLILGDELEKVSLQAIDQSEFSIRLS